MDGEDQCQSTHLLSLIKNIQLTQSVDSEACVCGG